MTKTLQKYGNSGALIIDKALMETMGIDLDTPLTVTVQGNTLSIRPANVGIGADRVNESLAKLRPQYDEMLRNLAK